MEGGTRMGVSGIGSATVSREPTSTTVATLAAAANGRRGCIIVNESAAVLYVRFGAGATATAYTYAVPAGSTVELPQPIYAGVVTGILSSGSGNAQVTVY
jgi:hypothetical protein